MSSNFSVLMSVYKSDDPEYLKEALNSVINQTLRPFEIIIVVDGPVPEELSCVIEDYRKLHPFIKPRYESMNRGLGGALQVGLADVNTDYIARMDSDDISLPDRFEKQMACFERDNQLSLVGGMITEFDGDPANIITKRILPLDDISIKKYMKSRCGVNHVTVIMKKDDLIKAGGYRNDYAQEDYYLWARMIRANCKFQNIPDIVVNVRSGRDQFKRRGGLQYYYDHCKIFMYMYREGLISFPRLCYNYIVRGIVQFVLPNDARTFVYQNFLRSQ